MSLRSSAFEPWLLPSNEFEITDVRLVATLHSNGRLLIENVARLICSEGRRRTYRFLPDRHVARSARRAV